MYLDKRWAVDYPEPDRSLELAAGLLAACPGALADAKTPKEIFDKTVELAGMFRNYAHRGDPPETDLSNLPSLFPSEQP